MSRYRIQPTQTQESTLLRHCADARYVWNLCVEQESWWRAGRDPMPGFTERCRQLTAAREGNPWLAEGSVIVQQQAIRDHAQAMANFFDIIVERPSDARRVAGPESQPLAGCAGEARSRGRRRRCRGCRLRLGRWRR